jgi:hypothetical protein
MIDCRRREKERHWAPHREAKEVKLKRLTNMNLADSTRKIDNFGEMFGMSSEEVRRWQVCKITSIPRREFMAAITTRESWWVGGNVAFQASR